MHHVAVCSSCQSPSKPEHPHSARSQGTTQERPCQVWLVLPQHTFGASASIAKAAVIESQHCHAESPDQENEDPEKLLKSMKKYKVQRLEDSKTSSSMEAKFEVHGIWQATTQEAAPLLMLLIPQVAIHAHRLSSAKDKVDTHNFEAFNQSWCVCRISSILQLAQTPHLSLLAGPCGFGCKRMGRTSRS